MFEIGKKYKNVNRSEAIPLTCVWSDGDVSCMKSDLGVTLRYAAEFKQYEEYKEPIKHVRYFNVYRDSIGSGFITRNGADQNQNPGRIGCVRVEFTEGQYDD